MHQAKVAIYSNDCNNELIFLHAINQSSESLGGTRERFDDLAVVGRLEFIKELLQHLALRFLSLTNQHKISIMYTSEFHIGLFFFC